jgi:Tfp pilus assembly protein PilZ
MTRTRDFSGLALRDVVAINVGAGVSWTSLSGIVVAVGDDHLEVALARQPQDPSLLAPGAMVRIRRGSESSIRAQAAAYTPGPRPGLAARLLAAAEVPSNHRAYHRVPVHLRPITMVASTAGRVVGSQGWVLDLSGGGARLTVAQQLAEGDHVVLRLVLPDETQRVEIRAQVIWVRPLQDSHEIGVRFIDLPDAIRDRIVQAVFRAELALRKLVA